MRTRVATFKEVDVQRALKAARKANYDVAACTIAVNGSIRLVFRDHQILTTETLQDWDDVLQ